MLIGSDPSQVLPILNSIGAFVYLVDVLDDGRFRFFAVNRRIETEPALYGAAVNVGKCPEDFLYPDHAQHLNMRYRQCVATGANVEFEGSRVTPAGIFWARHHLAPLFDMNGRIVRIMGTFVDITPRKRAEQALEESTKRYQTLYDETPARLSTLDMEGIVVSINEFGAHDAGYTAQEIVGKSVLDFVHQNDKEKAVRALETVRHAPEALHRFELCLLKKNGGVMRTRSTARVAYDPAGKYVILVASEDITEAAARAQA